MMVDLLVEEEARSFCTHLVEQKSVGLKFSESPNWKSRDVQLPSQFESFYFPHICAFVAILCLPFITINHTAYILTEDNNTFA
jgi:hypothetical protein